MAREQRPTLGDDRPFSETCPMPHVVLGGGVELWQIESHPLRQPVVVLDFDAFPFAHVDSGDAGRALTVRRRTP